MLEIMMHPLGLGLFPAGVLSDILHPCPCDICACAGGSCHYTEYVARRAPEKQSNLLLPINSNMGSTTAKAL